MYAWDPHIYVHILPGMPPSHPARDMQDTFYINTTGLPNNDTILLLRTHTSSVSMSMYVCMYGMYVCMYVCMCMCVCR